MSGEANGSTAPVTLTARLFTIESLIWMATVIFAFGSGYTALAKDNESLAKDNTANTEAVLEIRAAQKSVVSDISAIEVDISGIRATQQAQGGSIERILNLMEAQALRHTARPH